MFFLFLPVNKLDLIDLEFVLNQIFVLLNIEQTISNYIINKRFYFIVLIYFYSYNFAEARQCFSSI
jgi:hypothetical protein